MYLHGSAYSHYPRKKTGSNVSRHSLQLKILHPTKYLLLHLSCSNRMPNDDKTNDIFGKHARRSPHAIKLETKQTFLPSPGERFTLVSVAPD